MKGFIELKKADHHFIWLRAKDIVGVSEHPLRGSIVYVPGQAEGFVVQDSPEDIFDRLKQSEAE